MIEPLRRNVDLVGLAVGQLTVESFHGLSEAASGDRLWLCRCDCGGSAIRTSARLMQSFRYGIDSSCRTCNVEARRGFLAARRDMKHASFAFIYDYFGTVYGMTWLDTETEGLTNDIAEVLQIDPPLPAPPESFSVAAFLTNGYIDGSGRHRKPLEAGTGAQDWSVLFPTSHKGKRFSCVDCERQRAKGWVCVDCRLFVCFECGTKEVHRHMAKDAPLSYEQVVARFDTVKPGLRAVKPRKHQAPGIIGFDAADGLPDKQQMPLRVWHRNDALAKIAGSLQRQLAEQHNAQTCFVGSHLVRNKWIVLEFTITNRNGSRLYIVLNGSGPGRAAWTLVAASAEQAVQQVTGPNYSLNVGSVSAANTECF